MCRRSPDLSPKARRPRAKRHAITKSPALETLRVPHSWRFFAKVGLRILAVDVFSAAGLLRARGHAPRVPLRFRAPPLSATTNAAVSARSAPDARFDRRHPSLWRPAAAVPSSELSSAVARDKRAQ